MSVVYYCYHKEETMNDYNSRNGIKKNIVISFVIAVVLLLGGLFFIHVHNVRNETNQKISSSIRSTPSAGASPTTDDGDTSSPSASLISTYDWSQLKGQKLSNAYKIIHHDGISITDINITILTNDGKQVINPANWSITDISFSKPDKVLIHAHHDSTGGNETKSGDTIGSVIGNTLRNL